MTWECPSCIATAETAHQPDGPMHDCPGHAGLSLRLVPAGQKLRHRVNYREDYSRPGSIPQTDDDGRPVMSVTTDHPDGRSALTLFMPTTVIGIS